MEFASQNSHILDTQLKQIFGFLRENIKKAPTQLVSEPSKFLININRATKIN